VNCHQYEILPRPSYEEARLALVKVAERYSLKEAKQFFMYNFHIPRLNMLPEVKYQELIDLCKALDDKELDRIKRLSYPL